MAANDYFHSFDDHSQPRPQYHNDYTSHLPQDSYTSYPPHSTHSPTTYPVSPTDSYNQKPYDHYNSYGTPTPSSPPHVPSKDDQNPFADDVPLRPHPSQKNSELVLQNHLPDDPAILDRPPPQKYQSPTRRREGLFSGRITWVVYTLTTIQLAVFIGELAKNGALTKTPIEIQPQFNPMIGPSPYVLINMGARYVPCMRKTAETLNATLAWPCPNTTSSALPDLSDSCHLNNLCGFGDGPYTDTNLPHQWFRFIIPMFLHAGFIHIGFNMLLQWLLGREMEKQIGSFRFLLVYLCSGIFGFVLGGNFAPQGIASTGASGSLFGIIALNLLDLLYHWGERRSPWVDLAWILVDIGISFVLGLLPGLDNFSHIGGFLMGLVLGVCLLHSPEVLRRRVGDYPTYTSTGTTSPNGREPGGWTQFAKSPVSFFKGRKPLWWVWWLVRAAALLGVLVGFIVLLKNFWKQDPTTCSWCRYLSCIDIKNWCDIGQLTFTNTPDSSPTTTAPSGPAMTTSPARRDFVALALPQLI